MTVSRNDGSSGIDKGALFWGVMVGFLVGVVGVFVKSLQSKDNLRKRSSTPGKTRGNKPVDQFAEGMAEGKAAALNRRTKLGLDD